MILSKMGSLAAALVSAFMLMSVTTADAKLRQNRVSKQPVVTNQTIASMDESPIAFIVRENAKRMSGEPLGNAARPKVGPSVYSKGVTASRGGSSLRGVYSPLAAKASEISSSCGSKVISGVRHTRVAGTNRMSDHHTGHAVDMKGNPGCIYSHLRGWRGGYSTDYSRVNHVHISLDGHENGRRFAHGGGSHRHYASRSHFRVASR